MLAKLSKFNLRYYNITSDQIPETAFALIILLPAPSWSVIAFPTATNNQYETKNKQKQKPEQISDFSDRNTQKIQKETATTFITEQYRPPFFERQ